MATLDKVIKDKLNSYLQSFTDQFSLLTLLKNNLTDSQHTIYEALDINLDDAILTEVNFNLKQDLLLITNVLNTYKKTLGSLELLISKQSYIIKSCFPTMEDTNV